MKKLRTENPQLVALVQLLKKASRDNDAQIWRSIANGLLKTKNNRSTVNLSRINRYTTKGETVAVPGKVLGAGSLAHPTKIAALEFSASAKRKIKYAKGRCLTFQELVKINPKGSHVKIIG